MFSFETRQLTFFYFQGTYHNLASYMLMSEASVIDLNKRISRSPVNEHYFRPNIVVKGSDAYSEDTWDWIKIGENVVLRGFKHCIRYVVLKLNSTFIINTKIYNHLCCDNK